MKRGRRASFSVGLQTLVIAFCALAYFDDAWPHLTRQAPSQAQWVSAEQVSSRGRVRGPKRKAGPVNGVLDFLQLDGKFVEGQKVVTDRYHCGLEVGGWMVLERYRRPLFHDDLLWATLYNQDHEYHFRGVDVERPDIAQLFHLPTSKLGFRFKFNLEGLAPGEYALRIQRRSGMITPPLTIVRS